MSFTSSCHCGAVSAVVDEDLRLLAREVPADGLRRLQHAGVVGLDEMAVPATSPVRRLGLFGLRPAPAGGRAGS